MLEDIYYLQNTLMMKGISIDQFDDMDYYEMTKGLSARAPEDRPQELDDFIRSIM